MGTALRLGITLFYWLLIVISWQIVRGESDDAFLKQMALGGSFWITLPIAIWLNWHLIQQIIHAL